MAIDFTQALQAKATGKAGSTAPTGQTDILGQAAQLEQKQTLGALGAQSNLLKTKQAGELASIKQESLDQQHAMDMDRTEQDFQRADFVQRLMSQSTASNMELGQRRDSLQLEAAAHNLMMADETYTQQLREVGRRRRLTNAATFDEEMNKMIYGAELSALMQQLGWNESEAASGRSFADRVASLDLATALQIVEMEGRARSIEGMGKSLDANSKGIGEFASEQYTSWQNGPATTDTSSPSTGGPIALPTQSLPTAGPALPPA